MIHVINSHIISFFFLQFQEPSHHRRPLPPTTLKNVFNETLSRLFCLSVCCEAYRFYVLRSKRWKNSMFIEKILLSCIKYVASLNEELKEAFPLPHKLNDLDPIPHFLSFTSPLPPPFIPIFIVFRLKCWTNRLSRLQFDLNIDFITFIFPVGWNLESRAWRIAKLSSRIAFQLSSSL